MSDECKVCGEKNIHLLHDRCGDIVCLKRLNISNSVYSLRISNDEGDYSILMHEEELSEMAHKILFVLARKRIVEEMKGESNG